jgi:hypothetical protein
MDIRITVPRSAIGRIALVVSLATSLGAVSPAAPDRVRGIPDEHQRIPILVYHRVGDTEERWQRSRERFRADLQLLYDRGYRPIGIGELLDGRIDLPAGFSPVVITFDDASPSQFRYVQRSDGSLQIDPASALGIWLDFSRAHPDWRTRGVFCVLTNADAGNALFGDRGIDGQQTSWRHQKLRDLAALGFDICGHTDIHANLARLTGGKIQERIARGILAIDSALPGYRVRAFALPYGAWPANSDLVRAGCWTDPATGRVVRYRFDAILEGWGGTARSPHDPAFDPLRLQRIQVTGNLLEQALDWLEKSGRRYVADGA